MRNINIKIDYFMAKNDVIKRYKLILEKLQSGKWISKQELKNHLESKDIELSARTLDRDISELRNTYGVEIEYKRNANGYTIHENENTQWFLESFLKFLEVVNTADLLTETLKESKEALNFISFENTGSLKGHEYLETLLKAIKDKKQITFEHCKFDMDKPVTFTINPQLLKEYQGRWYIVGYVEDCEDFRTFGVDRIMNLKMKSTSFKIVKDASRLFDDNIGLFYLPPDKRKVILSFTSQQGKYIKTLPIHKSQKVLKDDDTELQILLDIIINIELEQRIMMYGPEVEVIEPLDLRDKIRTKHLKALKKYEDNDIK